MFYQMTRTASCVPRSLSLMSVSAVRAARRRFPRDVGARAGNGLAAPPTVCCACHARRVGARLVRPVHDLTVRVRAAHTFNLFVTFVVLQNHYHK
jgi:hypothetical protein